MAADHAQRPPVPDVHGGALRPGRRNYVIYRRVLAGAFAATVPLLVLLVIGGRQIVRGIMEGAVKS